MPLYMDELSTNLCRRIFRITLLVLLSLRPEAICFIYFYLLLNFFVAILTLIRITNYKSVIESILLLGEKSQFIFLFEQAKKQFNFINPYGLQNLFSMKYLKDDFMRRQIELNNAYWQEAIKINGFLSLFILFALVFLAVKTATIHMTVIIALMIINSRLSASASALVNRIFQYKVNQFHFYQASTPCLRPSSNPKAFQKNIFNKSPSIK